MDSYLHFLGLAGSAFSTLATLYFWLIRMRQERPCLRAHLVDREIFLGTSRDDERQLGLKVGVIVANYSTLPNAILGARLWVRLREGWQEVGRLAFDKQTPQPFNLPPLQTVLLRLTGTLSFPYQASLEEGSKSVANYLQRFVHEPLELKLELRHLNDRTATEVLTVPSEAERAAPALRPYSAAA
jgi:hypothetical protein